MRTIFVVCTLLFFLSCGERKTHQASTDLVNIAATADSSAATKNAKAAGITFEKTTHDFGNITQGEVVEYEFIFTNTGENDLLISNATASCGCTVPDYPKEPIAPGKQGKIKATFNSELRIDRFQKEIYITANTEPMTTTLTITGLIKAKPADAKLPSNAH
jgi:hypothetical protein